MRASLWIVAVVVAIASVPPSETHAVSRRKQCRLGCAAAVNACVDAGGKRARCRRRVLKRCRKEGSGVCAVSTTTTTTAVVPTTVASGGSTTTLAGVTTTTALGATTTFAATTTTPVPTTTSTSIVIHDCNSSTAVDLSGQATPTITFTNYAYTPACVRITAGQSVTFSGSFSFHPLVGGTVAGFTATPDPSSPIGTHSSGATAGIAFPSAGAFPFYCDNHGITQGMVGAVFVDP